MNELEKLQQELDCLSENFELLKERLADAEDVIDFYFENADHSYLNNDFIGDRVADTRAREYFNKYKKDE